MGGIRSVTRQEMGTETEVREDSYGIRWVVLQDDDVRTRSPRSTS